MKNNKLFNDTKAKAIGFKIILNIYENHNRSNK